MPGMRKVAPPYFTLFGYPDGLRCVVKMANGQEYILYVQVPTTYKEETRLAAAHMMPVDMDAALPEDGAVGGDSSEA